MQRKAVGQYQQRTGRQAPRPNTRNRSAQYEALGGWGDSTHQRANFKQRQCDYVGPFRRTVCVYLAKGQRDGACCEEVRARVPRQVSEGVELLGDFGDGGCEDGIVLDVSASVTSLWE